MPCTHTRLDVSRIVLGVIRQIHNRPTIVEATIFGPQGINADPEFRATYFEPIRDDIEVGDCRLRRFSPADCENAETVGDIVNAVWNDVRPEPALSVAAAAIQPADRRAARARKSTRARKPSKLRKPAKKTAKSRKPAKSRETTKSSTAKTRKTAKSRNSSKSRKSTKSKAKTKKR